MLRKPVYLTHEGYAKLEAELNHLKTVRRVEVANQIHQAKELADTVDNAEYDEAKNQQAFVEGRILTLEKLLRNAVLISSETSTEGIVRLGNKVGVLNQDGEEEHFTIVGSIEADPRNGKISNESPVGKALLERKVGEEIQVKVPTGMLRFTVIEIT